ncbi:50S ribosomal protein L25 [Clostridium grantii]|uniref:Large ribosomal subunit protein bL25 n=1 Tax=Clostridium grantii DSM 8605 TaxID=1121316 RepID=A0A1M5SM95_9CLOT|nr:50S ribosomal protein L25 [Clostridium grantii]SHH39659.1 large subunit ribosomal protein L25 [Clostridium grantii DSM 8605]
METIKCEQRTKTAHHSAKRERNDGKLPGIIYGHGNKGVLISMDKQEISKEIATQGQHAFLKVDISGDIHTAFIKEIQKEPVTHQLIHIDLQEVSSKDKIQTEVPIVISGEGSVVSKGGILQRERDSVKIKCTADNIPKSFNVDASTLNVGDVFRVADLEVAEEISFNLDLDSVLFSVNYINNKVEEEVNDTSKEIKSIVKDEEKAVKKEEMA